MNRGRGPILLALMCIAAQVACAVVPRGSAICIRPLLSALSGSVAGNSGEDSCCGGCCCGEDSHADDGPHSTHAAEQTGGPCRRPECTLCIRQVHQLPASRDRAAADNAAEQLQMLTAIQIVSPPPAAPIGASEHPPPSVSPPRSRALVGIVILMV